MQIEVKKHLYEMQQACGYLAQFVAGRSRNEYESDVLLRSGVERQFMIVGEALGLALKLDPSLARSITNVRGIIGFRNVVVHGYAAIDNDQVWSILQQDLPVLRREVDSLLAQP